MNNTRNWGSLMMNDKYTVAQAIDSLMDSGHWVDPVEKSLEPHELHIHVSKLIESRFVSISKSENFPNVFLKEVHGWDSDRWVSADGPLHEVIEAYRVDDGTGAVMHIIPETMKVKETSKLSSDILPGDFFRGVLNENIADVCNSLLGEVNEYFSRKICEEGYTARDLYHSFPTDNGHDPDRPVEEFTYRGIYFKEIADVLDCNGYKVRIGADSTLRAYLY